MFLLTIQKSMVTWSKLAGFFMQTIEARFVLIDGSIKSDLSSFSTHF